MALGTIFQDLSRSFLPYGLPSRQITYVCVVLLNNRPVISYFASKMIDVCVTSLYIFSTFVADTKASSRKWEKTSGTQGSMAVLAKEEAEKGF